jgi:general stress protein CsbA
MVVLFLVFWRAPIQFSHSGVLIYIPTSGVWEVLSPTASPIFVAICVLDGSHSNRNVRWHLNVVLIYISFLFRDVENFFMCFLDIFSPSFVKLLFKSLPISPLCHWFFGSFIFDLPENFGYLSLVRCVDCKDFLPFSGLHLKSGENFLCHTGVF